MKRFAGLGALLVGFSGLAAATVIAPCTNCWVPFNPATMVDQTGVPTNPYFVNQSQDGAQQGLGYHLFGVGPLDYESSGSAAPNDAPAGFYFVNPAAHQMQAQFMLSVTADNLEFGWYDAQHTSNLNPLFTRTGAVGSPVVVPTGVVNFTPTAQFGFYVRYLNVPIPGSVCSAMGSSGSSWFISTTPSQCTSPVTNQIVYSQSWLNSTGPNTEVAFESVANNIPTGLTAYHQHFVALQDTSNGNLIIGMEDAFGRDAVLNRGANGVYEGNGDYQDFVVSFSEVVAGQVDPPVTPPPASSVPEPSTMVMLGLGLAGVTVGRFRRKRA